MIVLKIPKIFHRIWIGGNPLPDEFVFYGETWEEIHPDWEMKLWTDDNMPVDKFQNKELYETVDGVVFQSDIARLELLYLEGGVYIDTDFECYKNIEPIIKDLDVFSCGEKAGVIGNAILGSTPQNPVYKKLLDALPKSFEENKDYGPNIISGPVFMTRTLTFEEMYTFSPHYFFPTPPATSNPPGESDKYPDAYGCHHWARSWVDKEGIKNWNDWAKENLEEFKKYSY